MKLLGNLIWLTFGGLLLLSDVLWGGLALCFTIMGISFGRQCFKIVTRNTLMPFGKK